MDAVVLGLRILLAGVFAVAAVGKLADQPGAREALEGFHVPPRLVRPGAWLLPLAELATAVALLVTALARWGAVAAVVLLGLFVIGIAGAMARGEAPDCHCFGQISSSPAGWRTLLRNAVLAIPAVLIVVHGSGTSIGGWIRDHSAAEPVALVAAAAAVWLGLLALRFWRQTRDLQELLKRSQEALASFPAGLPPGARAPGFALPDVSGNIVTLESLLDRGNPLALVFVSPHCEPCKWMMPDLARWQTTLSDRLTIALIVTGERSEIAELAELHQLENVLVQKEAEVFNAYLARATPSGVIVTPDGNIGSRTNSTGPIVESLIRTVLSSDLAAPRAARAETAQPRELVVEQWSGAD